MTQPLATCLCLTRNRREFLRRAIACFEQQTYDNRELLIVADGVDVSDLLTPGCRLVNSQEGLKIGAKRNFGCKAASGEIIVHWDDDDWSAPGRITEQVDRLLQCGLAATGYHEFLFSDGAKTFWYKGGASHAPGTGLCYWKTWWETHPFPDLQVGEDVDFSNTAYRHGQMYSVPDHDRMMVASIHPGNTSPRNVKDSGWKALDASLTREAVMVC